MDKKKAGSYSRILIKISGESLSGEAGYGIESASLKFVVEQLVEAKKIVPQIGVVVGGGNIFRGINSPEFSIDKISGDYMGMLATVINGIALRDALICKGVKADVLNSFDISPFAEGYTPSKALNKLKEGKIVIFTGGTGHPFFTTDTTGVLRALEISAEAFFKATKVDGVYSKDPKKDKSAKKYETLTYDEAIAKKLNVMDQTAIALAREANLTLHIFNFFKKGNLVKELKGLKTGSIVKGG
jgi:uridylate kinase